MLQFWKEKRRYMLVCMSAASNVTGIITDVDSVSKIAHKYGALVVYDYAAGGNSGGFTYDNIARVITYADFVSKISHPYVF